MTTNQTIDGVPGLRSLIERVTSQDLGMSAKKDRAEAAHELRALLDTPAKPEPMYPRCTVLKACNVSASASTQPAAQPQGEPVAFQARVKPWLLECFGEAIASDQQERNHRFLEESLELVQACGCTATEAHQLVDYVYGRPVGETSQEVGGVMVTMAALCLAHGMDMHTAGETELARIWTKVEQIRAKQAAKPAMSPLPGAYPDREQPAPVVVSMSARSPEPASAQIAVDHTCLACGDPSGHCGSVCPKLKPAMCDCNHWPAVSTPVFCQSGSEIADEWKTAQGNPAMCNCNQGRLPCRCKP